MSFVVFIIIWLGVVFLLWDYIKKKNKELFELESMDLGKKNMPYYLEKIKEVKLSLSAAKIIVLLWVLFFPILFFIIAANM